MEFKSSKGKKDVVVVITSVAEPEPEPEPRNRNRAILLGTGTGTGTGKIGLVPVLEGTGEFFRPEPDFWFRYDSFLSFS